MSPRVSRGARGRLFGPGLLLAGALAALLLAGCATVERQVLSADERSGNEVAVLSGTEPATPPPAAQFAGLTAVQAELSLKRLVVRPATWSTLDHGDPAPFLTGEQSAWAGEAIAAHVPRLRPDQRLQLRFRDRFHQFAVEVEVFGEGSSLVYRFTKLAAAAEQPGDTLGQKPTRPIAWVDLVEQPGQQTDLERTAYLLRDPVFVANAQGQSVAELSAALEQAVQERKLPAAEIEAVGALLRGQPAFSLDALRLYLDKLATVVRAQEQGLFTAEEAQARKRRLLEDLAPGAAPKP